MAFHEQEMQHPVLGKRATRREALKGALKYGGALTVLAAGSFAGSYFANQGEQGRTVSAGQAPSGSAEQKPSPVSGEHEPAAAPAADVSEVDPVADSAQAPEEAADANAPEAVIETSQDDTSKEVVEVVVEPSPTSTALPSPTVTVPPTATPRPAPTATPRPAATATARPAAPTATAKVELPPTPTVIIKQPEVKPEPGLVAYKSPFNDYESQINPKLWVIERAAQKNSLATGKTVTTILYGMTKGYYIAENVINERRDVLSGRVGVGPGSTGYHTHMVVNESFEEPKINLANVDKARLADLSKAYADTINAQMTKNFPGSKLAAVTPYGEVGGSPAYAIVDDRGKNGKNSRFDYNGDPAGFDCMQVFWLTIDDPSIVKHPYIHKWIAALTSDPTLTGEDRASLDKFLKTYFRLTHPYKKVA